MVHKPYIMRNLFGCLYSPGAYLFISIRQCESLTWMRWVNSALWFGWQAIWRVLVHIHQVEPVRTSRCLRLAMWLEHYLFHLSLRWLLPKVILTSINTSFFDVGLNGASDFRHPPPRRRLFVKPSKLDSWVPLAWIMSANPLIISSGCDIVTLHSRGHFSA